MNPLYDFIGIEKICPGDGQEQLVKSAGCLVQVWESRRHVKSAASRMFSRRDLEDMAPPPGMFLSHMLTMGSSDLYGPNRNADEFPHEELLAHHDATFTKYARNYREHRNNDPELAVGQIKAARYDPVLQRGEIVMWTEIEKAAREFEKARKGEEQHGSMACRIHSDTCKACGFISKTACERCDCILFTPGQWVPTKQAYAVMVNHKPVFKDYSWVERPADRIAHTMNYLMPLMKAASGRLLRGDELAVAFGAAHPHVITLKAIAEFDSPFLSHPAKQAMAAHVLPKAWSGEWDPELLEKMAAHAWPARVMRSMIKRSMVMPLASFNSWVTGSTLAQSLADPVVKEASDKMAGIRALLIRQIEGNPEACGVFAEACQQFHPFDDPCGDVVDIFMDKAREQFATRYEALTKRASVNPPRIITRSEGPVSDQAFGLGALYQAYLCKVAGYIADDWTVHAMLSALR